MNEIFRAERPSAFGPRVEDGDAAALSALRAAGRLADMWRMLRDVLAAQRRVPAAKIFYPHAEAGDPVWEEFRTSRILHLIRENILELVVSNLLATETGNWVQGRKHDPEVYDTTNVTVPPARCARHLKAFEAHVQRVRARYQDCDYTELTYAQIADLPTAERLLSAALDRPVTLQQQRFQKQRTRPLSEVVENYAEVAAFDRDFAFAR